MFTDRWTLYLKQHREFRGRCTDAKGERQFEAEVVAVTDEDVPGVLLRAPTKDEGMVRDTNRFVLDLLLVKYQHALRVSPAILLQRLWLWTS